MTCSTAAAALKGIALPAADAWRLKSACADSGAYWHRLYQDATDGKRSDLDADACARMARKAWELWELLDSQGC